MKYTKALDSRLRGNDEPQQVTRGETAMSMSRQTILASRPAAMVLALSMVAGLSAPFIFLPPAHGAQTIPDGTTELSAAPVDQVQAVPPNLAVTFDDSGSMAWDYLSDDRPFDNGSWNGPWECAGVINSAATTGINAHVMNGVYYNPKVLYVPPVRPDGTSFPNAGDTGSLPTQLGYLDSVWNDGIAQNRHYNQSDSSTADFTGTDGRYNDNRWRCVADSGRNETSPIASGGPYYYEYTGPAITTDTYGNPTTGTGGGLSNLYKASNWTAVAVPASQYQNWANWWAYYHTRTLMARTALSRVFGSPSLAAKTQQGGYGGDIRVAWQNINNSTYKLPSNAIISALIDTKNCTVSASNGANPQTIQRAGGIQDPPDCYRSAFFNWIFNVGANGGTPLRSALNRAGTFFTRGAPGQSSNQTLEDPYWQPPQKGAFNASTNPGNELYCRQNFSLIITDGLWNTDYDGGPVSNLTAQPTASAALPDGVVLPDPATAGVASIYAPQHDSDHPTYVSLSDLAYNYWATNLRQDLYNPTHDDTTNKIVAPYLPDTYTGVFGGAGNVTLPFQVGVDSNGNPIYTMPTEEYFNPKNDPASWPHMSDYMIGLGVSGILNFSDNTDCSASATDAEQDACDLRKGITNSNGSIGWPKPRSNGTQGATPNIDDTWHAALAGRGQFFSAGNPQQFVDQLSSVLSNISARSAAPTPSAVNASVATAGTLSFQVGHRADWSGIMQAVTLNPDGTVGTVPQWDAGAQLDARSASSRVIFTDTYTMSSGCGSTGTNTFSAGAQFNATTPFDKCENTAADPTTTPPVLAQGLQSPSLAPPPATGTATDTVANRVAYLAGDRTHEADGTFRKRNHILGAIVHSQPVYVSSPASNYTDNWPALSPEIGHSYDTFANNNATRPGTVYVGANDGMLHAFAAPAPSCPSGPTSCTYTGGNELWAFIPRAVYANLGNLTSVNNFNYRPTVDATPVTRDVFFSEGGTRNNQWQTILAGGVGLGGRGVYALDITNPDPNAASPTPGSVPKFDASNVLWEFDSDMTPTTGCVAKQNGVVDTTIGCRATDLGYTVSQPNIGRIKYGNKWVVLVPNGYFPDCSKVGNTPTGDMGAGSRCAAIAAQAPKDSAGNPYSALFVMDAQTGAMVAELKTPSTYTLADGSGKVISFGLGTPVMGDYDDDQVDDVAFAGDLEGNLWKFDLRSTDRTQWTVSLVYQGNDDGTGNQGIQPITTMPRLFPDPVTNSFMVVFGTGQYLGADDNGTNATQAIMGVRDNGTTYTQADLTQQYLHETTAPATLPNPSGTGTIPNPIAGATLRCVTGKSTDTCDAATASQVNPSSSSGGWFVNLYTTTSGGAQNDQGERVVVTPGAIFASNTVVFETLLTGSSGSDPCNPATQGAVMAFDAITGGPAGVSSLGGWPIVGGRVINARTSGSLPIVSALGGGQAYLPGTGLAPSGTPFSVDAPIWRRRSWSEINPNQ